MKFDDEVAKRLNVVVGESFDPPRNWRATMLKWAAGLVLAICTSVGVIAILHTHVMKAQTDAASKRPVQVHILPPSPPREAPAK